MNFNKVIGIEDFGDPELAEIMRDVCAYKLNDLPGFPKGTEHRKDWEVAMAIRALRHFDALRPDSLVLGVAAGTEDTLFYLTRHARQVFATDRYLAPGDWGGTAPVSMLLDPAAIATEEFDPNRLVVQHMDARSLRYPADTFDGIFSSGSIEHVGELIDVANAAYEMGRVLKPGGVLSLSTEIRLEGPPGGIGFPGLTLFLSPENLQRYIVDASGLEPVDDLIPEVSTETMATRRELSVALADHEARVAAGEEPRFTCWEFPHVILGHGEYLLTSVHLTLRKGERYPLVDNTWAAPSQETLAAIQDWDRSLLQPAAPGAPPDTEPAVSQAQPRIGPRVDPASVHGVTRRLVSIAEIGHRLDEVDSLRAEVDGQLRQIEAHHEAVRSTLEGHANGRTPLLGDRTRWAAPTVTAPDGHAFTVMVDPELGDPITITLAGGQILDKINVGLMLDLIRAGDTLLDIGAHLGQFSLSAAAAGCRVLAVEAAPTNAALLRASAARNGFAQLQVVEAAVSDRPGTLEFIARGPWGRVALSSDDGAGHLVPVPAVTIDEILAEFELNPTFVKIDVEGSEIPALDGMAALLSRPDAPPI
nr:class I SAM-dependent methyltransferase [Actinomycetota bacterium]